MREAVENGVFSTDVVQRELEGTLCWSSTEGFSKRMIHPLGLDVMREAKSLDRYTTHLSLSPPICKNDGLCLTTMLSSRGAAWVIFRDRDDLAIILCHGLNPPKRG